MKEKKFGFDCMGMPVLDKADQFNDLIVDFSHAVFAEASNPV